MGERVMVRVGVRGELACLRLCQLVDDLLVLSRRVHGVEQLLDDALRLGPALLVLQRRRLEQVRLDELLGEGEGGRCLGGRVEEIMHHSFIRLMTLSA